MRKIILFIIGVAILLLAGYVAYPIVFEKGSQKRGVSGIVPKPVPAETVEITSSIRSPPEKGAPQTSFSTSELSLQTFREISYEMFLTIESDDVRKISFQVITIASSLGGYIFSSDITEDYAMVIVKVPADRMWDAINSYRKLGKILQERMSAKDVTDRILDIDARLKNAKAEEQRLLELYSKAKDVNDMLAIEDRLSAVRERIERLEAMKKALENMVDYTTIHVEIRKPGKEVRKPSEWETLLRDAYRALMGSIYLIVVILAALLPIILIAAIIYWIYLLAFKRRLSPTPS